MATDSGSQPSEDGMLPDERDKERGEQLAEADDDELLTVDEVAETLGLDTE